MEEEEEQEVWSWGAGTEGQLGTGSEKDELLPRLVSSLSSVHVSALSCGGAHVIALTSGLHSSFAVLYLNVCDKE